MQKRMITIRLLLRCITTWLELAVVDIRLRWLPHRKNRALFTTGFSGTYRRCESRSTDDLMQIIDTHKRCILIAAARPLWFNMTCLRRSIVLKRQLEHRGIACELTFGVAQRERIIAEPRAHAWLQVIAPAEVAGVRIDMNTTGAVYSTLHRHRNGEGEFDES